MPFPSNDNLMAQLIQNGYSGDINTSLVRYLRAQYSLTGGQYNDLLFYHLGQLGYTGSLNDRVRQWDGTLFSPLALFAAGEKGVWYDPSDLSTLFQDSAGTTPVTAVGQVVGLMLDKSGNGYHATQATTAAKPILQQDAGGHYYLKFDGLDDFMVTPSIDFSGTDKMTVVAGVRKLSDAAVAMAVELSASGTTTAGAFSLTAPLTPGVGEFAFRSNGSVVGGTYAIASPFAAPITSVVSGIGGISTDTKKIRINGVEKASESPDQGTGNYGNHPLYIGMRAGTTFPFNGHLYSLVVRGALSDAAQISAAESYVNSRTGAF